jgi:hypothetical protein
MLCAQACVVSCARSEPPLPTDAIGWSNYTEGTTKFRGRFLLRTGESTDDGTIRVKVVELLPPKVTGNVGDFEARARVRIAFFSVPDGQYLSSDVYPENGGGGAQLSSEFRVFGVGVRAINLTGGWVYLTLTGDY